MDKVVVLKQTKVQLKQCTQPQGLLPFNTGQMDFRLRQNVLYY